MKTTGILMKPELVQASLDGIKDTTRRIAKTPRCRYGNAGDRLYVKETHFAYGYWVRDASGWTFKGHGEVFGYKYMDAPPDKVLTGHSEETGWYKRPSLFMPKVAARYFFEITSLSLERIQDITEEEAIREGLQSVALFKAKWIDINGEESWNQNDLVWVIRYKVLAQ